MSELDLNKNRYINFVYPRKPANGKEDKKRNNW